MIVLFASNLGWIARATACFANIHRAHDFITRLYCNQSSLMCAVIFKLIHDCTGCFAVVMGNQAVLCLLPNYRDWSVTGIDIFDLVMTCIKNWAVAQARRLPAT